MPGIAGVDTRHTEPLEQRRARQGQLFVAAVAGELLVAAVAGGESAELESVPGMPRVRVPAWAARVAAVAAAGVAGVGSKPFAGGTGRIEEAEVGAKHSVPRRGAAAAAACVGALEAGGRAAAAAAAAAGIDDFQNSY